MFIQLQRAILFSSSKHQKQRTSDTEIFAFPPQIVKTCCLDNGITAPDNGINGLLPQRPAPVQLRAFLTSTPKAAPAASATAGRARACYVTGLTVEARSWSFIYLSFCLFLMCKFPSPLLCAMMNCADNNNVMVIEACLKEKYVVICKCCCYCYH